MGLLIRRKCLEMTIERLEQRSGIACKTFGNSAVRLSLIKFARERPALSLPPLLHLFEPQALQPCLVPCGKAPAVIALQPT